MAVTTTLAFGAAGLVFTTTTAGLATTFGLVATTVFGWLLAECEENRRLHQLLPEQQHFFVLTEADFAVAEDATGFAGDATAATLAGGTTGAGATDAAGFTTGFTACGLAGDAVFRANIRLHHEPVALPFADDFATVTGGLDAVGADATTGAGVGAGAGATGVTDSTPFCPTTISIGWAETGVGFTGVAFITAALTGAGFAGTFVCFGCRCAAHAVSKTALKPTDIMTVAILRIFMRDVVR